MIKGLAGQFGQTSVDKRTWSVHICTCRDCNLLAIVESKSGEHGPEVGLLPTAKVSTVSTPSHLRFKLSAQVLIGCGKSDGFGQHGVRGRLRG